MSRWAEGDHQDRVRLRHLALSPPTRRVIRRPQSLDQQRPDDQRRKRAVEGERLRALGATSHTAMTAVFPRPVGCRAKRRLRLGRKRRSSSSCHGNGACHASRPSAHRSHFTACGSSVLATEASVSLLATTTAPSPPRGSATVKAPPIVGHLQQQAGAKLPTFLMPAIEADRVRVDAVVHLRQRPLEAPLAGRARGFVVLEALKLLYQIQLELGAEPRAEFECDVPTSIRASVATRGGIDADRACLLGPFLHREEEAVAPRPRF